MKIGTKSSNAFSAKYFNSCKPYLDHPIALHALKSLFLSRVSLVEYPRTQGLLTPVADDDHPGVVLCCGETFGQG